jgi:TP901 family phage tail tape measure protein
VNSFLNIQVRIIAQQAQRQIQALQRQINGLNFNSAASGAGGFGSALGGMRLDRVGSQMQWLGRQIEYNFTVPILLAGGAATKFSLDNERAFTRIQKVYGDGTQSAADMQNELTALQKAFVALSNQFGIAQSDALNIAADWAAAGASGLALAKSVQLTLQTMVLGELNAAEATQSLIAIQAQYGQSISELADTINILNMVENQTGISMAGLIQGFARTAGVARASGVGVRELAADLAALTPATGSAANAGNALKTIFSRLLSPTKDTAEVLGLMGINTRGMAWESANAQQKLLLMARSFETLSDAQKGLVSSIIASRYQVNRFEVLMNELTSSTGYYARALSSTADMSKVYAQAQKELNQVLTSNPQRLKVIWTTLQNAMADIIQPLIPLVLYLAQTVQQLVTAFSNLNPAVQKFVLFSLALLAAVGPVVRYLGAFQVLIFELAKLFRVFLLPIMAVSFAFRYLIALPLQAFFISASFALRGLIGTAAFVGSAMPAIFGVMWTATQAVFSVGAIIVGDLWRIWLLSLGNTASFFGQVIAGTWRVMWLLIEEGTLLGWGLVTRAWVLGANAFEGLVIATAAFVGRVWRIGMAAPLLVTQAMFTGLRSLFVGFIPFLRVVGTRLVGALAGPWGIAITIVLTLIAVFWKQIVQIWHNIVNFFSSNSGKMGNAFKPLGDAAIAVKNLVVRAFNALPSGIRGALVAVINMISTAAKAVAHWMSYLNPWAKHSPSLVDNVKSGSAAIQGHHKEIHSSAMSAKGAASSVTNQHAAATSDHADQVSAAVGTIKAQYAQLNSVSGAFSKASADLDAFAAAVKKVQQAADNMHYAEIRKQLAALASDALPAFDRLIKDLGPLQDELGRVGKQLENQQNVVDAWKQKLDDASNTLQLQKDVLDSMKNSVDAFSQQVQAINGDLETLTGTREMLRQAGAGSDILAGYDDQIKALKDQKNGINDQLDAAQRAYDSQKKLVDDLTIARDKLQASYDAENKKLQEIKDNYDQIKQKIDAITSAINDFKSAADSVQGAGGKQDDLSKNFAAGAGANFPDVGGGGQLGREGGLADQSAAIDAFTKEIQDKTKNLFGRFNFLDPIKNAWNKAKDWLSANVGPAFSAIGDFFSHMFDNVQNPLAGMDFSGWFDAVKSVWGGVSGFFKDIWNLIGPPLKEIGHILVDTFGKAFREIGPELAKFKDLVKPLGDLWKELAPVLKVVGAIIGGVILLVINILVTVLKNVLGPVLNWIISIIKDVIQIFRGLIEFIVGVFTGNWKLAWQGLKDFFGGIWDAIWQTIKNAGLIIWGIVKGIVEAIWNFFKWVWDELIGHSIIPDIINGIMFWFNLGKEVMITIWNAIVAALKWVWENILRPVFEAIMAIFHAVADTFKIVVGWVREQWDKFTGYARGAWDTVKQVVGWIKDKWNDIWQGIKDAVSAVKQKIDDFIGMVTGIKDRMKNAFGGMWDGIKNAFRDAINWIIDKWNNLSFHVGPFSFDTPDIPHLARGGMVASEAMAIVGEGRKGYPEYVIPTDPIYRSRALDLFGDLGRELGVKNVLGYSDVVRALGAASSRGTTNDRVQLLASGGILRRASLRASGRGTVVIAAHTTNNEIHFHGDLSFPNVKDGKDAEEFIKNLEALVGSS